jgi:histidine ammonia-lyase
MPPTSTPYQVGEPLTVEQLEGVAEGRLRVTGPTQSTLERTAKGRAVLERHLGQAGAVYGVTTGFGDSCETPVGGELTLQLPQNLVRFHGCGTGALFGRVEARAIVTARLASLAVGYSAVRPTLFQGLIALLERDIVPAIPMLGSVGASGDLTPLSYVAAVLSGERQVLSAGGGTMPAKLVLEEAGLLPLELEPKESLSVMNGTSAMTGLAALALPRALRLARWVTALSAAASDVMRGQPGHFDARLFAAKPHPGQAQVARWMREDLESEQARVAPRARLQDRYSIRCAPHVIGVLLDLFPTLLSMVEVELNSASDNPLADGEGDVILHGGHFYGGHVCAAMDTLKTQLANLIDLMDRQLLLLCQPDENGGLPTNLVGAREEVRAAHHGFKAMQITTSALAAEAARLTMPASVFSRSTESHNQDKVSMGTIAARDALTVLELAETTASILSLAVAQAVDLRAGEAHQRARTLCEGVRAVSAFVDADRALDTDIAAVVDEYRAGRLDVGAVRVADFRR